MSEIKVGEYVRTKDGVIGKVIAIANMYIELDTKYYDTQYGYFRNVTFDERITKHSENILDLIEVGDILEVENGICIHRFEVFSSTNYDKAIYDVNYGIYDLEEYLSLCCNNKFGIVTHEQFKNMEYRVGE